MSLKLSHRLLKVTPEKLDDITESMKIILPGIDSSPVAVVYLQLILPPDNVHTVGGISFKANDIIALCDVKKVSVIKGYRTYYLLAINYYLFQHTIPYKLLSL